jgi:hypothetical protein
MPTDTEIKEQETLLQTIRARLEWNENGGVEVFPDPAGDYTICERTEGKLIRYFTPTWVEGFDKYGNPNKPISQQTEKK